MNSYLSCLLHYKFLPVGSIVVAVIKRIEYLLYGSIEQLPKKDAALQLTHG